MTEWEKAQAGYLYDANYDESIIKQREACADYAMSLTIADLRIQINRENSCIRLLDI